jgi:hypothetical protein
MQGEAGERWRELCQQAAVEQDASKLLRLVTEINQLLEAKEQRLHARKQGAWNLLCDPVAQPRRALDSFQSTARSRSASCSCIAVVVSDLWGAEIRLRLDFQLARTRLSRTVARLGCKYTFNGALNHQQLFAHLVKPIKNFFDTVAYFHD